MGSEMCIRDRTTTATATDKHTAIPPKNRPRQPPVHSPHTATAKIRTTTCKQKEHNISPVKEVIHVMKTLLNRHPDVKDTVQVGRMQPLLHPATGIVSGCFEFPLLGMMRAKPQFDHGIDSFHTYNPPVYLYHGCPTRFCHRVLSEGRVLRGDRTLDGKYGICAFVEWLRALDYAQAAGDWAVIFKLAAWASKSTHMKGALLLREPWLSLIHI